MQGNRAAAPCILLAIMIVAGSLGALVILAEDASALAPHDPILIESDDGFNSTNGVIGGAGTVSDPYIIDGWEIQAYGADGIQVRNTTAHFIVSNVSVLNGNWYWNGISLNNVTNATVKDSQFTDNNYGVRVIESPGTTVQNCSFTRNYAAGGYGGVQIDHSDAAQVSDCSGSNVHNLAFVNGSSGVTVLGNSCQGTYASPTVLVTYSNGTTVHDNQITSAAYGVWLAWATNSSVTDNSFSSCDNDVEVQFSNWTSLTGNRMENSLSNGISLGGSHDINVWDNVIRYSGGFGVYLVQAKNCSVSGNEFLHCGIVIEGSTLADFNSHSITTDNIVTYESNGTNSSAPVYYWKDTLGLVVDELTAGQLIVANCSSVVVQDMELADCDVGLQMAYVSDVFVYNVTVSDCKDGIRIFECSQLVMSGMTVTSMTSTNHGDGLSIIHGDHVEVSDSTFSSCGQRAVVISDATSVSVINNAITQSHLGLTLESCDQAIVRNNTVTAIDYEGMTLRGGSNGTIAFNTVFSCDNGVRVEFTENVSVVGNNISHNVRGALLNYAVWCYVHHNTFWENSLYQALTANDCQVSWDDGYPSGGNYWSDYSGDDVYHGPDQNISGPDGLGDTPYSTYDDVFDRYPLVGTFINYAPTAVVTLESAAGDLSTVFSFDATESHDDEQETDVLEVRWDWTGDGVWDTDWSTDKTETHQYDTTGTYTVRVEVRDSWGSTDTAETQVEVFEAIPEFSGTIVPVICMLVVVVVAVALRRRDR